LLTVIIPTNRVDPWLEIAVRSVLDSQDVELRLVVVLDGVAVERVPAWADDPRVIIEQFPQNRGPAAAMVRAMELSPSEFVARLDGDDRCLPNRFARQLAYLSEHPETVAVSTRTMRIDEEGRPTGLVKLPAGADIRPALLLANVIPHPTLLFRRSAADEAGGYDPSVRQMEDYDFTLRLALLGPIAQLEDALVEYRVHPGQMSRGNSPFDPIVPSILGRRRRLGRTLGRNPIGTRVKEWVWLGVQLLRYAGIIRPGHER
jgi:glycosyltransferase involved in cell wall biosynthesis